MTHMGENETQEKVEQALVKWELKNIQLSEWFAMLFVLEIFLY